MAGGPLLPSSIYLGAASGNLYPQFYSPTTNSSVAGTIEGVGCVASLGSTVSAVLQFNIPEVLPPGQLKLRTLFWANATTGNALITPSDSAASPGGFLGTSLTAEPQITFSSTQADRTYENKTNLTTSPSINQILTVNVTFNSTGGWTLAAASVFQFSVVWE